MKFDCAEIGFVSVVPSVLLPSVTVPPAELIVSVPEPSAFVASANSAPPVSNAPPVFRVLRVSVSRPEPAFVNPPEPLSNSPVKIVFPVPATVRRFAPLLTVPPRVKRFAELFVHVCAAPTVILGFSVTAPAPVLIVMPPAPATVSVFPVVSSSVTVRVSGAVAAFTVRLPMDMLEPRLIPTGLVGVAGMPAEKKTFVPAPGTSGVAVPVLSEAQFVAVPVESDQSPGPMPRPPTQKAFASGVAAVTCTVSVVAVATGAPTVKFVGLLIVPSE